MRFRTATAVCCTFLFAILVGRANAQCAGDCDGDGVVETFELVTCVNVSLLTAELSECPECSVDDDVVGITDLITAVANSMDDECAPVATPTATPTPQNTGTATPTPTGTQSCPLDEGEYTLTQTSGGQLTVSTIPTFPFPEGGTIVMDVGAASFPECKHPVNIDFPGGFNAPVFCIVALGFTVDVAQTGCGIGELDSNGGSDYTVSEIGDTSDASVCENMQACAAAQDSNARVDITVGDGEPDQCTTGTANLITSVPVFTTTWSRTAPCNVCPSENPNCCDGSDPECCPATTPNCCRCPDVDGTYDPGTDSLIVSFPQTLDFTSDSTIANFADLDGDGCCIAGAGPASVNIANCDPPPCTTDDDCEQVGIRCLEGVCQIGGGPLAGTGTCIDLEQGVITSAAAGPIGSRGAPLYDLTFLTVLPNTFERTGDFGNVTCEEPPILPIGAGTGTAASRCVEG